MEQRSAREVAERCLILRGIIAVTHGRDRTEVWSWLRRESLLAALSTEERDFLSGPEPSEHDMVQLSWRAEALAPLLWAIGLLEELPPPVEPTDFRPALALFPRIGDSTAAFLSSAQQRDESDIIAQLNQKTIPNELNPDIVIERVHALNWLTGRAEDWDD